MNSLLDAAAMNLVLIGAFAVLMVVLYQARRATSDVMANIDRFGDDQAGKQVAAQKALFNFYAVVGLVVVVVIASLRLVSTDFFVGLLVAILTGLGIKLTADVREK